MKEMMILMFSSGLLKMNFTIGLVPLPFIELVALTGMQLKLIRSVSHSLRTSPVRV